jgi:hypothetical protein
MATKGRYYIARSDELEEPLFTDAGLLSGASLTCVVCEMAYERPDMAACPFHEGTICSLCCSLDADCHDMCKHTGPTDLGVPVVRTTSAMLQERGTAAFTRLHRRG